MERPVELIRDNRAKEILHGIQEAVRVRYRGFRSLIDIRKEVKNEIVQSKSRLSGIAQVKNYSKLFVILKQTKNITNEIFKIIFSGNVMKY